MISGGNATVYVSDMDAAVRFYTENLGLKHCSQSGRPLNSYNIFSYRLCAPISRPVPAGRCPRWSADVVHESRFEAASRKAAGRRGVARWGGSQARSVARRRAQGQQMRLWRFLSAVHAGPAREQSWRRVGARG